MVASIATTSWYNNTPAQLVLIFFGYFQKERAERKAVLFNATPRSIEYRWDADAPRPELNLFIHKQQFTQFDEWPSPPSTQISRDYISSP